MAQTPLAIARVAAAAADGKKATDIVLIDLTGISDVCDYFLICTVANGPQMDSVLEGIRESVAAICGIKPISTEGGEGGTWVVMYYGSLVAHVFRPEARDHFRLERLWGEAPRIPLDLKGATAAPVGSLDDAVGER